MMDNKLIIYGCGGHARSVCDVALYNGYQSIVFVDPNAKPNETILGFAVTKIMPEEGNTIIGMGDNYNRSNAYRMLLNNKTTVISLIANDAYVAKDAKLNTGVFVAHRVHIGPNVVIGENTLLNTHAIIEHDVEIGKHCHVSVNAVLAGKTKLADFVSVGAGVIIIENINVCSNVIIGAGAVVIDSISQPGTYVGIPARRVAK